MLCIYTTEVFINNKSILYLFTINNYPTVPSLTCENKENINCRVYYPLRRAKRSPASLDRSDQDIYTSVEQIILVLAPGI